MRDRPLARDDLEIAPRVVGDDTVYFVGDPIRGEWQQLDELQYEIFSRLDGRRSLEDLAKEIGELFDAEVEPEELAEFIDNLQELRLLDITVDTSVDEDSGALHLRMKRRMESDGVAFARRGPSAPPPSGTERRQRYAESALFDSALAHFDRGRLRESAKFMRSALDISPTNARARYFLRVLASEHWAASKDADGHAFFLRIPLSKPDRFFGRLDRAVGRLLYNRIFLTLWALFCAGAIVLFIASLSEVARRIEGLMTFEWLLDDPLFPFVMWTIGPLMIFTHELCHGLTLKHFGGRVHEGGILIVNMSPSAYCDISSSYLLESRWQRALVSLAGPMWNIAVWGLWVYLFYTLQPDTMIGRLAAISVVILLPGIAETVNVFNRNDAYLAFSDLLNYPNLRTDSFEYLKLRGLRWLYGSHVEIPEELEQRRQVYLWYAVPGAMVTAGYMGGGVYFISWFLIDTLRSIGIILACGLIFLLLKAYGFRVVAAAWRDRKMLWSSRNFRRLLFVVSLVVMGTLVLPWPLRVDAPCFVDPELSDVRAPQGARLEALLVAPGERVEQGQILALLESAKLRVEVQQAFSELEQARLDFMSLTAGARDEELDIVRAELSANLDEQRRASRRVRQLEALVSRGLSPAGALDQALAEAAAARTGVGSAQKRLAQLASGAAEEELKIGRARIARFEAQLEYAEQRVESMRLRSPRSGIVHLVDGDPKDLIGAFYPAGATVVAVRPTQTERISLRVPANEPVDVLQRGAAVEIRFVGIPDTRVFGTITSVSGSVEPVDDGADRLFARSVVRLEATVDAMASSPLPVGLSGTARVTSERYPIGYHLYVRLVRLIQIDVAEVLQL